MNFLIDAQLPERLCSIFSKNNFDCKHTLNLPLKNFTTDSEIIKICEKENRILITKDKEFEISYLVNNIPPKLILVTTGNISNKSLLAIFSGNFTEIINKISENNFIEISSRQIITRF